MEPDTERKQFTFYRSYYDALRMLPDKARLAAYDAIAQYGLAGVEYPLKGSAATAFILIKPTLDSGRKKAKSGKRGGDANKAMNKQTGSKPEANAKQTAREIEGEIEKEVEIEKEDECLTRAREDAIATVMSAYLDKINPTPSQTSLDELKGYVEQMGAECCLRAFDIALDNKATKWPYIKKILSTKLAQGVQCIADWDDLEQKREGDSSANSSGDSAGKWNVKKTVL